MIEWKGASPANEPASSKRISATTIAATRLQPSSSLAPGGNPFPRLGTEGMPNAHLSCVYDAGRRLTSMRDSFLASRRNHEDILLGSTCGRRLAACGCRLRPGKENQAVGPTACCRKDGSGAECGSHHSRILDRKRKGPNSLRSGNDRQRP